MKSTRYRPREEHPRRSFNAQSGRQGPGFGTAGTGLSQQIMLSEVILTSVESKEKAAVEGFVDLSQEAANIMKLAYSVSLRQTALSASSRTAQAVMSQF